MAAMITIVLRDDKIAGEPERTAAVTIIKRLAQKKRKRLIACGRQAQRSAPLWSTPSIPRLTTAATKSTYLTAAPRSKFGRAAAQLFSLHQDVTPRETPQSCLNRRTSQKLKFVEFRP